LDTDLENLKKYGQISLVNLAYILKARNESICHGAVNDIFSRTLGRSPHWSSCDVFGTDEADEECLEIRKFVNGYSSISELNHYTRSTREYQEFNLSAKCQIEFPNMTNPHAIGEYVAAIYRLLLNRRSTKNEMKDVIDDYYSGDTKPFLSKLVIQLQERVI
jgi:hypothetical protein